MPAYTIESARSSKTDERFGFETHGKFRCQYSIQKFYMILIAVICFIGLSSIADFMIATTKLPAQALLHALAILVGW